MPTPAYPSKPSRQPLAATASGDGCCHDRVSSPSGSSGGAQADRHLTQKTSQCDVDQFPDPEVVEVPPPGPARVPKTDRPPWRAKDPYSLEALEACRDTIRIIRGVLRAWPSPSRRIPWSDVQNMTISSLKKRLSLVSTGVSASQLRPNGEVAAGVSPR